MRIRQTLKRAAAAGATILAATTIYLAGSYAPTVLAQSDAATPTPSPTAPRAPSTTGIGISVISPQPDGGYYAAGEVIKFKVPMSGGTRLRPIVINEAVAAGTYFQFRYTDNTGHPAYREPQTANLAAIVDQGAGKPQYLIYEHTVAANVSTNAAGTLYYAEHLYKTHDAVCGPTADNCLKLTFAQPAGTDPAIDGVVRVAAGGAWNYAGRAAGDRPATAVDKVRLVDPPADGVYTVGDTVRLQAEYNKRLHPVPSGAATGGDVMQIRVTNLNEIQPAGQELLTFRTAPLAAVYNASDKGYAEYAYTVLEKDQDTNGIQVVSFTESSDQTKICPEVIGAGCDKDATVENSNGRHPLANVQLNGKGIGWSDVIRQSSMNAVQGEYTAATAVAAAVSTPSGSHFIRPVYYKVANLPPGMEVTQSMDTVSIGGTPTQAGTFATVITAVDGVGQKAAHTVNITVTTPDGPAFTAARNDLVVYQDDATQGNQEGDSSNVLTLPAVSGGTQPVTYDVSGVQGSHATGQTCPSATVATESWIKQPVASGSNAPGTLTITSGAGVVYQNLVNQNLVLKATDASGRTACWPFAASVQQRATLGASSFSGNAKQYFRGDKIAIEVTVTNGPVTVAQGEGKTQPQLNFSMGGAIGTPVKRTATYVNAGGGAENPHQGNKLRFEYEVSTGDYARSDVNVGKSYLRVTSLTQRDNVKDANGHVVGGSPGDANILGEQQQIHGSTDRPEFEAATYEYTKWRDETFSANLDDAPSQMATRQFRLKHNGIALPAAAPSDTSSAPYGLHFNASTRQLAWPDNAPATGDNLSATLTYEVYLPARQYPDLYNYPEYVADTATVTVTRKERPLPTQVILRPIKQSKSINDGGSESGRTGEKHAGRDETLEPGDHVDIRVVYDAPVAFSHATERPAFNLTVGNVTRQVTLNKIDTHGDTTNNAVEGRYTVIAADQGAIGTPDLYLKDQHLLVGASTAPAAERGNAVRPSLRSDTEKTGRHGHVVQSGGPAFSVDSDHTVTLYGTVNDSVVLPAATSPTGKDLTYTLRQDYSNSPNLGSTAEANTGLKFDAATRTLSRDKGEVPAIVNPTTYILTAEESGTDGKDVSLKIGVNLFNQPEATVVQPFFHRKDDNNNRDNLKGDMAAGDTLLLNVTFNKNVKIKDDEDSPAPKVRIAIGDNIREVPLSHRIGNGGERINLNELRGEYTVVTADHDHDGITLASDWLVNSESVVGTEPSSPAEEDNHATYENPVRYASVTSLTLSNGQITAHADFGWPEAVGKPELTIIANREYRSSADNLGNALPAANAARNTRGIGYRVATPPTGLSNNLYVAPTDKRPRLVGTHSDPDRSEHGVKADYTVTANAVGPSPVDSDTLTFSIRIISDVHLDDGDATGTGTAKRWTYPVGNKIRVIVNHNAVVDFADSTQPTLTLSIGGVERTATYTATASDPASGKHIFEYVVVSADGNANGGCAVTGMTNDGGIAPTIPDGGITLTNCYVNRAEPSFASSTAEKTVYVAKERGGIAPLPQATGGVAPVTYALVNEGDSNEIWGRSDLTLTANDDGSQRVNIPAIPPGSTTETGVSYEQAQYSKLVATDALGNAAEYKFTVTTVQNVPASRTVAVSDAPTGRDFFRVGDEIVVTVDYSSDKRIASTGTATEPGAYVELTVGNATLRAYAQAQTAEASDANDRYVKFGYTVQAGDTDSDGVTVGNVIRNCDGLTGHYTDSLFENGLGKPTARMHQMVDGCPLPVATPSTTAVNTARDPGTDLDRDDDGLIDITTAQQLILMSLDPNGDGIPMEAGKDYTADANFDEPGLTGPKPANRAIYYKVGGALHGFASPSTEKGNDGTTNGCPNSKCVGYELLNDIDMSGIDPANPLGARSEHKEALLMVNGLGNHLVPWQTVLEGNGYRVLGLNVGNDNASSVGFIRDIGPNGLVRNLGFVSPRVRGDYSVGIIAGTNAGLITNVFVQDGAVTAASANAGLITGQNGTGVYNSTSDPQRIERFWATGAVTAPNATGAGAAVGMNYGTLANGWTDAWPDAMPVGDELGRTPVTGYGAADSTITAVREVHPAAASGDVAAYLITPAKLTGLTADSAPAPYLGAAHWDYGDNCQRPVLSSGGHLANRQNGGQGATCASSGQ